MFLAISSLLAGLFLLVWSADRFVAGSASLAKNFGIPSLLIGMIIIGFGTSAPEMVVSVFAAFDGNSGIALGNVIGSNIVNIALILGVTALIRPLAVSSQIIKKEIPFLIVVTLASSLFLLDQTLSRLDAAIYLSAFSIFVGWSILQARKKPNDPLVTEPEEVIATTSNAKATFSLVVGLIVLIASSRMLVWGAVSIATSLGVSELIIGLTIVAIGTSLPELASSIMAARKGENDLAIGNIIGSNLFNSLAVSGLAGVISPLKLSPEILKRDLPVMILATVVLYIFCSSFKKKTGRINRYEALTLLTIYFSYTAYLVVNP